MRITSPEGWDNPRLEQDIQTKDFIERVRINQQKLTAELKAHYDCIVCGSGSSGSVVARRLAENADVKVLLLEAGASDDVPSVMDPGQWPTNLSSERDRGFIGKPNPHLKGRSMGKVLDSASYRDAPDESALESGVALPGFAWTGRVQVNLKA